MEQHDTEAEWDDGTEDDGINTSMEPDEPLDGAYPPDPDGVDENEAPDDGPGKNVPQPKAKGARKTLQANKPKSVAKKRVRRGSTRILVQQKRRQALEYRKAGMTYAQIAEQIGYSNASAARKAVIAAFGEVVQEPVADLKNLQVERLNHMLLTLWGKVSAGDEAAINTSLRIMDKMDALMGTDAARQVEVRQDSAVLVIEGNQDDYVAAMRRMAGIGVQPDGTNAPQQPAALPSGPSAPEQPSQSNRYPPGMGPVTPTIPMDEVTQTERDQDIVDAVVVDDDLPATPTKKSFNWSTEPKVKPRPKDQR